MIANLKHLYGDEDYEYTWLDNFASNIWSEYSLYTVVLLTHGVFDTLHVDQKEKNKQLHCEDVWYAAQLPWNAQAAVSDNVSCFFSVIQVP